jgi:hypothetical protein
MTAARLERAATEEGLRAVRQYVMRRLSRIKPAATTELPDALT